MGTFPFWACLSAALAGSVRAQRRCAPTALQTYLRLLPIVTRLRRSPLSASCLSPSRPCTPTFDDQSPAVGRCRLPSTWGAGVDRLVVGRTCLGIQLSKSQQIIQRVHLNYPANLPLFPQPKPVSSEQVAHARVRRCATFRRVSRPDIDARC